MFSYNPYSSAIYDPYHQSFASPSYAQARAVAEERERARARARAKVEAEARAQAAQQRLRDRYLIPEYEEEHDSDGDDYYGGAGPYTPYGYVPSYESGYGLSPRERAYLQAKRREQMMEAEREKRRREDFVQAKLAEEARRREAARRAYEEAESLQKHRTPSPQAKPRTIPVRSPSPEAPSVPRSPPRSPPHDPRSPSPSRPTNSPKPQPTYTEAHHTAASTIQRAFRIQRSLHKIALLQAEFAQLKAGFSYPPNVDFQGPDGGIITLDTDRRLPVEDDADRDAFPKLAYTRTNVPLHAYTEALNRLLVRLDGVESFGDRRVRDARKDVVRSVETEAGDVERWWQSVWEGHHKASPVDLGDAVEVLQPTEDHPAGDMEVDGQDALGESEMSPEEPTSTTVEPDASLDSEPKGDSPASQSAEPLEMEVDKQLDEEVAESASLRPTSPPVEPDASQDMHTDESEDEVVDEPLTPTSTNGCDLTADLPSNTDNKNVSEAFVGERRPSEVPLVMDHSSL